MPKIKLPDLVNPMTLAEQAAAGDGDAKTKLNGMVGSKEASNLIDNFIKEDPSWYAQQAANGNKFAKQKLKGLFPDSYKDLIQHQVEVVNAGKSTFGEGFNPNLNKNSVIDKISPPPAKTVFPEQGVDPATGYVNPDSVLANAAAAEGIDPSTIGKSGTGGGSPWNQITGAVKDLLPGGSPSPATINSGIGQQIVDAVQGAVGDGHITGMKPYDIMAGSVGGEDKPMTIPKPGQDVKDAVSGGVDDVVDKATPNKDGSGGLANVTVPELGDYPAITDEQGNLLTPFKMTAQPDLVSRLDMSGVDALKTRATAEGPSAWLGMATQKQGLEETGLLNSAAAQAAGSAAQARANLAMRGGLRGGAAERLAGQAGNDLALARQGVRQQGALERAGLGVQDELIKTDLLKQLPGAQLGAANYVSGLEGQNILKNSSVDQFNILNAIKDMGGKADWKKYSYGEGMKLAGSNATANALMQSGKK